MLKHKRLPKTRIFSQNPLYAYLMRLNKRLKLHLSEGVFRSRGLYSLGIKLATESRFVNEVKLGILLLGFLKMIWLNKLLKHWAYIVNLHYMLWKQLKILVIIISFYLSWYKIRLVMVNWLL